MKHTKKLASLLLALVLAFALAVPAFAEDGYSITITNSATGHTYEAYQIFTGDLAEKDGKKVTYKANCPKMNAPGPELKRLYGPALVYVALPLAIGTTILGDTDLKKGIVFSDELDPDDFLKRMMDTGYPYKWKESVIEG